MTPNQIKALASGMCHSCSGILVEQHDKLGNDILRCKGRCKGFINADDAEYLIKSLNTNDDDQSVDYNQSRLNQSKFN